MACLKSLSVKVVIILKKNIGQSEKALYCRYLGNKDNGDSIENIIASLRKVFSGM